MRKYALSKQVVLRYALMVLCVAVTIGCSRPVTSGELIGTWTLVASGFEPMEEVVPNDHFSGWVAFKDDLTYEMEMLGKGRPRPEHRTGTYSVEGNKLQTVSGAKVSTSRIVFQGRYLVTVTRQIKSKKDFYMYYLPASNVEKPKAAAQ